MRSDLLAATLAAGFAVQAAPAAAWYQWYYQEIPIGPGPAPYGAMYSNGWPMPNNLSGVFVAQGQSPAGYHIRVYTPGGSPGSVAIGVEVGAVVVRSGAQAASAGPFPSQQSTWSAQWVRLPADANLAAMRMSRNPAGVEIFVPRFR
jgi:hypothetical protein